MKAVMCPSCGAAMKRNGRTKAGTQRWRCRACGASTTVSYDDTAARLEEFLAWLTSKDTQLSMPGQGRTFRSEDAQRVLVRVWHQCPSRPRAGPQGAQFVDGMLAAPARTSSC